MIQQVRFIFLIVLGSVFAMKGYTQDVYIPNATSYRIESFGSVATHNQTPFWMASNKEGLVPVNSNNGYLQTGVFNHRSIGEKVQWYTGLNVVFSTPRYRNVYVQNLYTELAYDWLHLSIGSKNNYGLYNYSLTDPFLSSGNLARSLNARPIPEINLFIPDFVMVPGTKGWLHLKGHFAVGRSFDSDYLQSFAGTDQHYIQNVLWHHKSLLFQLKDSQEGFPLAAIFGIHHTAQWGGTSTDPSMGKQPHSFKDFFRIVFGRSGGEGSSFSAKENALGAHYGVYDSELLFMQENWSVSAYYQHIFNDGSGMIFRNRWDGLKGFQLNLPKISWLQSVVIEHLVSLDQSGPFHFIIFDREKYSGPGGGADDYYNNGEYRTGASYFNRGLGSPLLISPEYNANGKLGFKHNRIRAWHMGASGNISDRMAYRFLLSNTESFGTAYEPTLKRLTGISFTTDLHYHLNDVWKFSASIAGDTGNLLGDHWGVGLSVTRRGILRK